MTSIKLLLIVSCAQAGSDTKPFLGFEALHMTCPATTRTPRVVDQMLSDIMACCRIFLPDVHTL